MKPVLLAVCRSIELEEPELDRTLGEGGVEVQHMVAAVIVMLASAVVGILTAVPDISKLCYCGRLFAVELTEKVWVNHSAVAVDAVSVKVQRACQKVFVTCHDVGEVPKRLGRVSLSSDVDVNAASPCGIAFRSGSAQAANQLLQGLHVGVGEDRCDHFAFLVIGSRDADILLEFPFPSALVPRAPSEVPVAACGVLITSCSEELCGELCGFLSDDTVHLDLDPDGLLFHFGYMVFCSLAHFCALRFGLLSRLPTRSVLLSALRPTVATGNPHPFR